MAAVPLALAWLIVSGVAFAQTPEDIFNRGNAAYEDDRFDEAADAYRALLRYEIHDPLVEFNLGNAEFRLGNLGAAILHYERARRLDPVDADILANLEYARSFCFDRVEVPDQGAVVRWLHAAQNRLGPDRQAWFALGSVWAIAGLLAWCFSRPGGWTARHGWILSGLVLVLVLSTASWYTTLHRTEGRRQAIVMDDVAEVLAGPGLNNPALFTVHEGLRLDVRAEREEWFQVSLPNGLNGWISREAIEDI